MEWKVRNAFRLQLTESPPIIKPEIGWLVGFLHNASSGGKSFQIWFSGPTVLARTQTGFALPFSACWSLLQLTTSWSQDGYYNSTQILVEGGN